MRELNLKAKFFKNKNFEDFKNLSQTLMNFNNYNNEELLTNKEKGKLLLMACKLRQEFKAVLTENKQLCFL